jgi:sRNA-binding protein
VILQISVGPRLEIRISSCIVCRAVLNHQQRIALDGSPAEMVEAEARDLAIKHLARRAAESSRRRVAPNFIMG